MSARNTIEHLGGEGILTEKDLDDLGAAVARVYKLMKDERWHSTEDILATAAQREGLRRMRELRRWFTVERRRLPGRRSWEYKLVRR